MNRLKYQIAFCANQYLYRQTIRSSLDFILVSDLIEIIIEFSQNDELFQSKKPDHEYNEIFCESAEIFMCDIVCGKDCIYSFYDGQIFPSDDRSFLFNSSPSMMAYIYIGCWKFVPKIQFNEQLLMKMISYKLDLN